MRWTTWGSVRGQGRVFGTREAAERSLHSDRLACRRQGGRSDRSVVVVGDDGYLYHDEAQRQPVWPSHGRGSGAVRAC